MFWKEFLEETTKRKSLTQFLAKSFLKVCFRMCKDGTKATPSAHSVHVALLHIGCVWPTPLLVQFFESFVKCSVKKNKTKTKWKTKVQENIMEKV